MTLEQALAAVTAKFASDSDAANALGVNRSYWYRMVHGQVPKPSQEVLDKLGLVRHESVTYEWLPTEDKPWTQ